MPSAAATILTAALVATPVPEADIADRFCEAVGGEREVRLADGSRVDCLTKDRAWEVERSHRWPEAIGQSAWYAVATDRRPGIAIILDGPASCAHWIRLLGALELAAPVWQVVALGGAQCGE